MSIYAPKLSEKEAQNIVSEVFRDTGYRLERRDPVFVQYIVQKMLLQDFAERQAVVFDGFVERTLPTIKNEAKILAGNKSKFEVSARSEVESIVEKAGADCTKRISEIIHKTDSILLENLNRHVAKLQSEQDGIIARIREESEKFTKQGNEFVNRFVTAADRFSQTLKYFGGFLFLLFLTYAALEILET